MSGANPPVKVNFLSHVKKLIQDKNYQDEATFRNVISKAYYAAYHRAAEYFGKYPDSSVPSVHSEMQQWLWKEHNEGRFNKSVCTVFKAAKGERIQADYHLDVRITETDASRQIARIESFYAELKGEENKVKTQLSQPASLSDLQNKFQTPKKS